VAKLCTAGQAIQMTNWLANVNSVLDT